MLAEWFWEFLNRFFEGHRGGSLYVPSPLLDALIRSTYFDPITGEWRYPDFSITVTTTAPRPTDTTPGSSGSIWTPLFPPPLQGRPPLIGPWEPRPPGQDLFGGGGGPSIPEKPEPRPEAGIVDWIWDPDTGQWIPVYSVTGVTSPPDESRTTTVTSPPGESRTTTVTSPPPGGWIYDPFRDVYIPLPGITFVVDVTTTRPDVEYHTAPIPTELTTSVTTPTTTTTTSGEGPVRWIYDPVWNVLVPVFTVTATTTTPQVGYHTSPLPTELIPGGLTPWPPFIFTTTWEGTTTTGTTTGTETTTTDTTTTGTTTTAVGGGGPGPGMVGQVSGAGAPMPGPPAPVVGRPLGESVWQLSQYIPALVPHLGYFLAGR